MDYHSLTKDNHLGWFAHFASCMSYVGVVVLTLMKGDEGVQAGEERADQALFSLRRDS